MHNFVVSACNILLCSLHFYAKSQEKEIIVRHLASALLLVQVKCCYIVLLLSGSTQIKSTVNMQSVVFPNHIIPFDVFGFPYLFNQL